MTAEAHPPGHPVPARTPAEIHAALTGADRAEFERAYQAALGRVLWIFRGGVGLTLPGVEPW